MSAFDVGQHAFGLRMLFDGLAAPALQSSEVIQLDGIPTFDFGVSPRSLFMNFWRVAFGLVLGGNSNPDTYPFVQDKIFLHSTTSYPKTILRGKNKVGISSISCFSPAMAKSCLIEEQALAALAKKYREAAGKSKVDAARELKVAPPTIFQAEEKPETSLTKLRIRMIEIYSPFRVVGPVFMLARK